MTPLSLPPVSPVASPAAAEKDSWVQGVAFADQVRCLDWRARHAQLAPVLPVTVVALVVARIPGALRPSPKHRIPFGQCIHSAPTVESPACFHCFSFQPSRHHSPLSRNPHVIHESSRCNCGWAGREAALRFSVRHAADRVR